MTTFLTQQLNSLAGQSWPMEQVAIFLAMSAIWLMALGYLLVWHYRSGHGKWHELFLTILIIGALYVLSFIIGYWWFEPRPYAAGLTDLLISEPGTAKSFPSDHAAIAFALALAFLRLDKRWGWFMLLVASLVALARVAVGVHYIHDVVGGAVLGVIISLVVAKIYNNSLARLHHQPKLKS